MGLSGVETDVYPANLPQTQFLRFYAGQLNAVQVNYTFCGRHILRTLVADRWLAQTPDEFLFTFRGPKPITHFYRHRLHNAKAAVRQFQITLAPFKRAGRLGPVLFELPKTFAVNAKLLDDFPRQWPRELRVSFEFRNASWYTDQVYQVLRRRGAALCLAERDEMQTPEILTAALPSSTPIQPTQGLPEPSIVQASPADSPLPLITVSQ